MRKVYRLSDNVIAQIAKILQLAIITQTDVTDFMRQIVLEPSAEDENVLKLTPEYEKADAENVEKLVSDAVKQLESLN